MQVSSNWQRGPTYLPEQVTVVSSEASPDMNLRALFYKTSKDSDGGNARKLSPCSPMLTRLLWFLWKDMRGWDCGVFTFILFIITLFSMRSIFSLQAQKRAHVLCATWAVKEKIWALRKGLVCGRHVCFVFTHTQTCQTNNSLLPPPTCSNQSGVSIATLNFLPLSLSFSNKIVWNKVFDYCGWRERAIKTLCTLIVWLCKTPSQQGNRKV